MNDSDQKAYDTERLLSDFFRSERPHSWPEPPWRRQVTAPQNRRVMRGRSVLVAALVMAAVGLWILGEAPSQWPGSRDSSTKAKMEASRQNKIIKPAPLPGFRIPGASKSTQSKEP